MCENLETLVAQLPSQELGDFQACAATLFRHIESISDFIASLQSQDFTVRLQEGSREEHKSDASPRAINADAVYADAADADANADADADSASVCHFVLDEQHDVGLRQLGLKYRASTVGVRCVIVPSESNSNSCIMANVSTKRSHCSQQVVSN